MTAARTDKNQKEIVKHLRKLGAIVAVTSHVKEGFPDLLVGNPETKQIFLIEVKSKNGKLTDAQKEFHALWCGLINIVRSIEEAENVYYGQTNQER